MKFMRFCRKTAFCVLQKLSYVVVQVQLMRLNEGAEREFIQLVIKVRQ